MCIKACMKELRVLLDGEVSNWFEVEPRVVPCHQFSMYM